MTKTVYVVAHTHWDHEWYFTQEDSDIILVENLDFLIETLEQNSDFNCYTFDGQFSIIEKYLKIRPENSDRVRKLIFNKRLFVGPWYTQADALLGKTESLIRNLLYGIKYSEDFGHSMNIGYAPDIFGQHMYLPSIYKRFGIDYSIFQRGLYNEQVKDNLNFWWESPNKEKIKTNNVFFGYGPGKFLSSEADYIAQRLNPILKELENRNKDTHNILLPAGGDQVIINTEFTDIVQKLNQLSKKYEFVLSDFESYMIDTWEKTPFDKIYCGEFLASQKSRIHNTCRSQRYDIKKLNYQVEDKLINVLEPLCVIGQEFNIKYPSKWIDQIWKKVFDSQAHNGIGASNSDDANHDIVMRLTSAHRQIEGLINLIKKQIVDAIAKKEDLDNPIVLFNTNIRKSDYKSEVIVFTKTKEFKLLSSTGEEIGYDILTREELDGGKKVIVTSLGEREEKVSNYYKTSLLIKDINIPAMGFKTLLVVENGKTSCTLMDPCQGTMIENESIKINYRDESIVILNKLSGEEIINPFYFEDVADAGDSFDYSPLIDDIPINLVKSSLVSIEKNGSEEIMTLRHSTFLPSKLDNHKRSDNLKEFTIITKITLRSMEDHIRVYHEIDNNIEDHRLKINWLTNVDDNNINYADQGFSLVKRESNNKHLDTWREEKFVEKPMPIYPLENVAIVADDKKAFSIHTGMIKEYQVLPEKKEFSLTLFRSNGLLGKDDLEWRPGRASGINNKVVTTPEGQMLTKMTFEYYVTYSNESLNPQKIFEKIDQFQTKRDYYQLQSLNTFEHRIDRFSIPQLKSEIPREYSLFEVENKNIFMSAVKKGWTDGVIVRFYNPTLEEQKLEINFKGHFNSVEVVNLKEEYTAVYNENLKINPKDYITLKLKK